MATVASRGNTVVTTTGTTWANTANAIDGTVGTSPATYATYTDTTKRGSATIVIGGYTFSSVGSGAIINSVTAAITHIDNASANFASVTVQLETSTGTAIGSAATATLNTSVHTDTLTLGTPTAAQVVAGLRILTTITRGNTTTSTTFSLDQVDVTVTYTDPTQFFSMQNVW